LSQYRKYADSATGNLKLECDASFAFFGGNSMMKQDAAVRTLALRLPKSLLFLVVLGMCWTQSAFGAADPEPCATNASSRQLDYWLGTWTISSAGAGSGSKSTVSLSLDHCLVTENWDGGQGHSGKNLFAYSPGDKRWYGMFADNRGHVHVFTDGKVSSGSAEFYGPSLGPNGEAVLNRIKIVRLSPNKVEQTWEKSTDSGASWKEQFRLEYSRANP
jgi:hypothetical protein